MPVFTTSHYVQLILAIILATVVIIACNVLKQKHILTALIVLIPFQLIDSSYGSINVFLTYAVAFGYFANRRIRHLPLLPQILVVIFAYLISVSLVKESTYFQHVIYLISIGSNFLLLFLVYNYIIIDTNWKSFFSALIIMNVFVLLYCMVKLIPGIGGHALFGIQEFTLHADRLSQGRLVGPFKSIGLNAEYLVIQIFILGYIGMYQTAARRRIFLFSLIMLNFAFLLTTGNRGGFLTLIIGCILYAFYFSKRFDLSKLVRWSVCLILAAGVMSYLVLRFTPYNVLFDRLMATELKEGMPESRYTPWVQVWTEIKKKPVIGHGPQLKVESTKGIQLFGDRYTQMVYPHNLYLFLLYTLGSLGLGAYLFFFYSFYRSLHRSDSFYDPNQFLTGLPRLGKLVLILFMIDQIKIEFLRDFDSDYQHYIFLLIGGFLALSNLIYRPSNIDHT